MQTQDLEIYDGPRSVLELSRLHLLSPSELPCQSGILCPVWQRGVAEGPHTQPGVKLRFLFLFFHCPVLPLWRRVQLKRQLLILHCCSLLQTDGPRKPGKETVESEKPVL